MMKKLTFIIYLFTFTIYGNCQEAWTLRKCINYAIDNNIDVKQQAIKVKSSEVDLNTSKNSRLPDLNASVGQSFNFGRSISQLSNTYESATTSNTSWGGTSTTPIFTGFRISNDIKAKELSLKSAIEGLNKVKDNLELQITSYYLDVLFKKEVLKVYQKQAELTSNQVEKTKILYESGKVALSQVYDIQSQLASDELNITNANNDLQNSILNLSQALNLQSYSDFDIATPELQNIDIAENTLSGLVRPEEVYQKAIAIKPHIKEAIYNIESSKKNLKVAQAGYWPSLNLQLGYNNAYQHRKNSENKLSFSDQIKNNRSEYISLNLSIPIFDRFETRNQVRQARLNIQSQELNFDNVKLNLYKEIQQAYQNAVAAKSKYNSTTKANKAASESFKYAEERYQIGKTSVYEYSEAMTKLITSEFEQIQAKYDYVFRTKILDFYQGKQIDL